MARTRSQSREPSVEPRLVYRQARTVGEGTAGNVRQAQQQLEPLSEGPSEMADDDGGRQSAASENEEVSDSDSAPIETFSQTELQRLDPVEMESNLEELNGRARRLLGCFRTRTGQRDELELLIREAQDPDSGQRRKADDCRTALENTRAIFSRGAAYLKLDTILRGLLRKRNTQPLPKTSRPWRPDDVICKANLAILVHTIMTQPFDDDFADALVPLDESFPSSFVAGFTRPEAQMRAGYSALVEATFEFALNLRTQLLVGMLNADMSHDDAAEMIQKAMLDFDENDDSHEDDLDPISSLETALSHNRHAKGWEFLDPHGFESSVYADKIIQRTKEITALLFSDVENRFVDSSASLASGLVKLRERFPREQFQKDLLHWSNLRLSEIDDSIKKLGGIDEIITALENEIRQRLDTPNAYIDEDKEEQEALPSSASNALAIQSNAPSVPTSSTKVPARPSVLFRGRPSTSTSAPVPSTAREEQVPDATRNTDQVTDDAMSSTIPTQDRPRLTGKLARANALDEQERRKRRFIDEQANGVRIVDDILNTQPSGREEMEIDPVLEGDVQDPSEDEGYQVDQRNLVGRRPAPRSSAAPRQTTALTESTQPARRRDRTPEHDSPNKRQRRNPGQSVVTFRSTGDDVVDSFNLASVRTRQIHAATIKPQRGRKPWTDAEVGALLRLIRDHGISFAFIKSIDADKADPELEDRTAEDIRFKAREIKVKFLIAERPLPENLGHVPLGKKEIEKVKQHVPYEQKPLRARARIASISPRPSAE